MNRIPIEALIGDTVSRSEKFGAITIIVFASRRYLILTDLPGFQGAEAFNPGNWRE